MSERVITGDRVRAFEEHLLAAEKSGGTVAKYLHDVRVFSAFAGGEAVTKQTAIRWKAQLIEEEYAPRTINSMLSAVNGFFRFLGWDDCRVKFLRVQRRTFQDPSRVLSRGEYEKLLAAAKARGQERLALLMEAICATGIRVSEVRYITVEALRRGVAEISLKGKIRTILLPSKLCRKLLKYAKKEKIASGEIFLTKGGIGMNRRQIWAEMKSLCAAAGVEATKVFPHNLRRLFARVFYRAHRDIVKLADTLGHSSVDTTRIYLISTGREHRTCIEQLKLVS